eukprot:753670-Hanusia_phi.AAC.4
MTSKTVEGYEITVPNTYTPCAYPNTNTLLLLLPPLFLPLRASLPLFLPFSLFDQASSLTSPRASPSYRTVPSARLRSSADSEDPYSHTH